jgi:hypothetical protein
MRRNNDGCTLDPGLTELALRGVSKPASYPFAERHLWRKRAAAVLEMPAAGLRGLGYRVDVAAHGPAVLTVLTGRTYDLL